MTKVKDSRDWSRTKRNTPPSTTRRIWAQIEMILYLMPEMGRLSTYSKRKDMSDLHAIPWAVMLHQLRSAQLATMAHLGSSQAFLNRKQIDKRARRKEPLVQLLQARRMASR